MGPLTTTKGVGDKRPIYRNRKRRGIRRRATLANGILFIMVTRMNTNAQQPNGLFIDLAVKKKESSSDVTGHRPVRHAQ